MITLIVIAVVVVAGLLLNRYFQYANARQHVRTLYRNEINSWKKK